MNTHPSRIVGFRKSAPFGQSDRIGWRLWVGPLLVARTPGIGIGVTVGWTR